MGPLERRWPGRDVATVMAKLDAEQDTMGYSIATVLTSLDADLANGPWDRPPRLWAIHRRMLDPETLREVGAADGLVLAVEEMDLPSGNWDGGRIAFTLTYLAGELAKHRDQWDNVVAWLLVHEAWAGLAEADDAAQLHKLMHAGVTHTVDTLPDRLEIRQFMAVDNIGRPYMLVRDRASGDVVLHAQDDAMRQVHGRVHNALKRLAEATS